MNFSLFSFSFFLLYFFEEVLQAKATARVEREKERMSGWRSNRRDYQDQHGGSSSSNYRRPYSHQDHFPPSTSPAGRRKPNKRFGLFGVSTQSDRRKLSIPLKSVSIQANVVDFLAQVEVTQQFVNLEENPIETTYVPHSRLSSLTKNTATRSLSRLIRRFVASAPKLKGKELLPR